ncbi:MAG: succinate dehydrogenase, cytochrome b556 subunit [Mesorhizobium sp.]
MSAPATRAKPRPTSPHLMHYRLLPTMLMSGIHRVSGFALYFGTLLVVWWVTAAAGPEDYFNFVNGIYGSWFGQFVLFGYTWALIVHMLGGIRHFIWDTGAMLEKRTATKLAWATLFGSIVLTVLLWAVIIWARSAA